MELKITGLGKEHSQRLGSILEEYKSELAEALSRIKDLESITNGKEELREAVLEQLGDLRKYVDQLFKGD